MAATCDTTFHADGTVTYWSVYRQQWMRHCDAKDVPACELAAMDSGERSRIMRARVR